MAADPGAKAVERVREAFAKVRRPEGLFIRDTCRCCECEEHNATLAANTPDSMSLRAFGNAGWDPMCFASDQAFAYFLPGMFRLAFDDDAYIDQLLFHLGMTDRLLNVNAVQARAMAVALRRWAELHHDDRTKDCWMPHLHTVVTQLEKIAAEG